MRIKVINKYFALIWYGSGSPGIEPNPYEMAKQYCMLSRKSLPLPRYGYDVYKFEDDYPDLVYWWETAQNHTREVVEPLDFSLPFDPTVFPIIHSPKKKPGLNPDDLINAELADLDDTKN